MVRDGCRCCALSYQGCVHNVTSYLHEDFTTTLSARGTSKT